jgi:hypothetical protein
MNRVNTGNLCGADDIRDRQIALRSHSRPNTHGLVCKPNMQSIPVSLRINSDRGHAELTAGSDHTEGNFPPVCHQDLGEHLGLPQSASM